MRSKIFKKKTVFRVFLMQKGSHLTYMIVFANVPFKPRWNLTGDNAKRISVVVQKYLYAKRVMKMLYFLYTETQPYNHPVTVKSVVDFLSFIVLQATLE